MPTYIVTLQTTSVRIIEAPDAEGAKHRAEAPGPNAHPSTEKELSTMFFFPPGLSSITREAVERLHPTQPLTFWEALGYLHFVAALPVRLDADRVPPRPTN